MHGVSVNSFHRKETKESKKRMIFPPFLLLFSQEITVNNYSYSHTVRKARRGATDMERKLSFSPIRSWKQGKYGLVFTLVFGSPPLALKSKAKGGPCLHIFMMFLLSTISLGVLKISLSLSRRHACCKSTPKMANLKIGKQMRGKSCQGEGPVSKCWLGRQRNYEAPHWSFLRTLLSSLSFLNPSPRL